MTMVQLGSPVPFASTTPGLAFGVTNVAPYSPTRPHGGKDRKWSIARPVTSRQIHASAAGVIKTAYDDGQFHQGWGNYIDLHITTEAFTRLAHHKTGSTVVKPGQIVADGARLATMGDTGETNGVHSHEELWLKQKDGTWKRVDPDLYRGPNGRHLPGTPLVSEPKPAPAGGNSKPATPATPIQEEDDDMTIYVRAKGQNPVYEVKDGKRRQLGSPEWEAIKSAFHAAGRKLPYSDGVLANKVVLGIPEAGK